MMSSDTSPLAASALATSQGPGGRTPLPEDGPDAAWPARPLSGSQDLALGHCCPIRDRGGVLSFQLAGIFVEAAKVVTVGI